MAYHYPITTLLVLGSHMASHAIVVHRAPPAPRPWTMGGLQWPLSRDGWGTKVPPRKAFIIRGHDMYTSRVVYAFSASDNCFLKVDLRNMTIVLIII